MISIRQLKKSFGNNVVLENINVEINKGDVIGVIGPSGCGKSTLIRCINLLEAPDSGEIRIDGVNIAEKNAPIDSIRQKMGMVYQNFNLFSHKTVLENVIMAPIHLLRIPKKQAIEEAFSVLKMVGMSHRADFMPDQLSGGQKQRAAIARCLAMKPEIILFDEPTSALDPTMIDEVLAVIRKLVKTGITSVIVTHEMGFARNIANRIFFMEERGIYEEGTPDEIFDHPKREKTKIFIQKLKIFEYKLQIRQLDIYELAGKLSEYGQKYDIAKRQMNGLNLILEEILVFLSQNADHKDMTSVIVSYQEANQQIQLEIRYGSPSMNVLEHPDFDEISRQLIHGLATDISCLPGEMGYTLKLTL
ncbi:MAG: amino acid ABC transporter ATP-binding protein [Thermotogaceae bacterium]|nr:amino acid ABC transporter ATP-binding protein [Thermotogaceae bacterium]HNR64328.1 amino acid ABC transporter ATP-binding protein [Thermotogota bacterium]HPB88097.1 amino acid ABC transporter ATP-binding protein [Thermotogota bacterium]HQQ66705.1 amino acid ABC transporter ATP-binding protein [Thermotogota bacterium]